MKTFKDVLVWKKGYELSLLVYKGTQDFPRVEEFGLKSQLRRASVSLISNFAEGFKKFSYKERVHYFKIAEGSLEEIKCQTMLCKDLGYFSTQIYAQIEELQDYVGRLLYGWIRSQTENS